MIVREIEDVIRRENGEGEFIYPDYNRYCFSNIPSTILKFFNIKTKRPTLPPELHEGVETKNSNKIVLLMIDGFGYNQWLRCYKNCEFFDVFSQKGMVSPITTVFPSTTAATSTTMDTGLTPQEHGLPEWVVYFKEIDMIINTIPFRPLDKAEQDSLLKMGVDPKILYRGNTIYQTLKKENIKSFVFMDESYAYGSYSQLLGKGSTTIPFKNSADLVIKLRKVLEKEKGPAYFYVYVGDIDSVEHQYGPYTEECYTELSMLSFLLKEGLLKKIDRKVAKETLLLATADHGQVSVSPEKTIYLNKYEQLGHAFQKSRGGKSILPTGSPRDVFLHVNPDKLDEIYEFLSDKLKKNAKIMRTDEAIKRGLFGIGRPTRKFLDRVGNLLVLPYKKETIWYEHLKGKKLEMLGLHGGLSIDEMLVPFAVARLSDLV